MVPCIGFYYCQPPVAMLRGSTGGGMEVSRAGRRWFVLILMCLLTPDTASTQQATAELNGRVTDTSGAVLPGVSVTATQTATGLERTAVTDATGAYLITKLPPG